MVSVCCNKIFKIKLKVTLREGLLERILEKSIPSKLLETSTRNGSVRAETVGSLLATIPAILQVHEQSYDNIGDQISSGMSQLSQIGSGLIAAITSVGEKMHEDAVVMHKDLEKNAKTLHQDIVKLDDTQHDGMHSLMSSFTDEDNNINGLTEALHDGLDMISLKMPEKNHLEEEVHNGFDALVESLSDKDELGSIIHDGLHDLSEHIGDKSDFSQVLHNGLDGIQDALVSARNPVVNLPASFGTSCKSNILNHLLLMLSFLTVGNALGTQVLGELSNNLNEIMESIDDHGDTVKEALRVQQVIEAEEQLEVEAKQESGEQGLVSAMHDIISAITNSQDKLSDAVENGHNQVSLSITRGNDKLADAVTTGHEKVSSAVSSGSDKMSSSLDSGHQKIASSVLTAADSINDVADAVEVCDNQRQQY